MPPVSILLLVIGPIVLAIVFGVVSWRKERARTEALRMVAETAGLAFEAKADLAGLRSLADVQLFSRGGSKRATNVMTGRIGEAQLAVFDYSYTIGSGKSRRTTSQTVVLLPAARPSLPDLQMTPENPLYKLAEAFGFQDIDIESSPEFSRRYVVKGANEEAIRAALYPGATSYFAEHGGWTVEAQSGNVAIYRDDRRTKPEDMPAFIQEACTAVRAL